MVDYWKSLIIGVAISLGVGSIVYFGTQPPPGISPLPISPAVLGRIVGFITFMAATTLQAIWYLVRQRFGVSGALLITAGTPGLFVTVLEVAAIVLNGIRTSRLNDIAGHLAVFFPSVLWLLIWLLPGACFLIISRRNRPADTHAGGETDRRQAHRWPPMPGRR